MLNKYLPLSTMYKVVFHGGRFLVEVPAIRGINELKDYVADSQVKEAQDYFKMLRLGDGFRVYARDLKASTDYHMDRALDIQKVGEVPRFHVAKSLRDVVVWSIAQLRDIERHELEETVLHEFKDFRATLG